MKDTLTLKKAIQVDGEDVKELHFDFDEMTVNDKLKAGKEAKKNGVTASVPELDSDYHFFLFATAVQKEMPQISVGDLKRMSLKDSVEASNLARGFFYLDTEASNTSATTQS